MFFLASILNSFTLRTVGCVACMSTDILLLYKLNKLRQINVALCEQCQLTSAKCFLHFVGRQHHDACCSYNKLYCAMQTASIAGKYMCKYTTICPGNAACSGVYDP